MLKEMERHCIFCPSELDNSDEHIIPQSINGTLHSKRLICHDCNTNFFGRQIDPVIKKLVNPLLVILGWENASALEGEDIDGGQYVISKGVKSRPIRPLKEVKDFGKVKIISIKGDPKNTLKMFQKEAQKIKEQGKVLVGYNVSKIKDNTPFIRAKWEIEISLELILLMNKIAVEFYSYNNLDYTVIEELCKRIRNYDKSLSNTIFCNQKNEVRDFEGDEISHLILIQNDNSTGHLYAYIEIFNLICCTVILSENYRGQSVSIRYHQDALTGERFTNEVKLKMSIKEILSHNFVADNFQYLNNSLASRLRARDFNKVFKEQLVLLRNDLKDKEKKGEIKKEDFEKTFIEQSAELIAHLTIYHYPYILGDQADEDNDDYNYIHSNFRKEIVDKFCKEHQQLLGKKVKTNEGLFTIAGFYQRPHIVKNNKELVTLFFILVNDQTEVKKYIKVKTIIDNFIEAIKQIQAARPRKHE
ncbi:MAG: HNH endonuclease [Candidatus Nitrosocosmicus sp.]